MRLNRPLGPILAITFDLDDTLYDNVPVIARADRWFDAALEHHPLLCRRQGVGARFDEIRGSLALEQPRLESDVTLFRTEALRRLFLLFGAGEAQARREAALVARRFIAVRSSFAVPQESLATLRRLGARYRLAAVSNGNADTVRLGLADVFAVCLRADRETLAKPAPDLFLKAAEAMNVRPQQVLHVGDDPVTDVLGARRAGLVACQVGPGRRRMRNRLLADIEVDSISELETILL
ncbi:MAG: HAD-IA family hydrolase [Succinivibrionaceae bacterium]|nr:HAD-IA family hydrolase [Succinivibrionaceae bacterium]